ncbi:major facilitator superfamily domain-containing protein [Penicillium lagena]|uniref:major facilitator superfamily domain-containing protein n=1 Tax=Penicillium lagena TaxID=94218 RepID=UPI002542116C|nr:major facilitator superfamily domain-containing protein [Penicillium lagena]KAJ5619435.1 major facilitator superfamily domain-containing protein [Penicillium lagena]
MNKDLDRNNIGNAKEAGMAADLGLTSSDYSLAVSIFFIGYLLLEVPSNMILSRTRPSLYLPALMIVWGCMVIGYVGVNSKRGLIGLRFALGLIEAGYFPGVLLFMSNWYKKAELARRFSIFYCASLVSGAVGGLIAGLILEKMQNRAPYPAWKWLFLIEGVITIGCAIIAIFVLPDFPATTKWLSPEEREYAVRRLEQDDNSSRAGDISHWKSFTSALRDWRTWLFFWAQTFCTCAGTITYFVPTLMAALNYTGQNVQYMTIPIYMVALVIVLICGFSSDYFNERPKHIMAMAGMSTVSLIIVATVDNAKARYTFLAFGAAGIWCCSPLTLSYLSNTIYRPAEKRAVAIGFVNAFANLSSVYGAYIWPASSAPEYAPGFAVSTILMFLCIVTALLLMILTKKYPYENTKDGRMGVNTQPTNQGSSSSSETVE